MNDLWRRLAYRWFVQYNPLYLVSAMLVLGGTILTSRGLATEPSANGQGALYGPLGVAAIAEVYALALIGGAALLTRIGQRRPAVMLALLTALYQCDLTLHTETCVQLGVAGACAAVAWLALFLLKLLAVGWAMKVRISLGAFATAALGATGLVIGPYIVEHASVATGGAFIATWVFLLGIVFPTARVASNVALDPWGSTVLGRTARSIWILWGTLLGLHVLFWASGHTVALGAVVPAAILLAARRVKSEPWAWAMIGGTLLCAAFAAPAAFALLALLAAVALVLRAYGRWYVIGTGGARAEDASGPYRMGEGAPHDDVYAKRVTYVLSPLGPAARARHFAGALLMLYLAAWTTGWHGGAWPEHSLALDVGLVVAVILLVWRTRRYDSIALPACFGLHAVVTAGLVPTPHTMLGWGGGALALGFALLLAGLATSYRLRGLTAPPS